MRLTLLLVLIVLGGCRHTRSLDPTRLNARATRQPAALVLTDGQRLEARALHVAPDVTTWLDPATGAARSVPTSELASATVVDRSRGTLEGLGIGLATGAVLGTGAGALWEFGRNGLSRDSNSAGAWGAAVGGGIGGGLGALIGRRRGSRWVYFRPGSAQPRATPPASR